MPSPFSCVKKHGDNVGPSSKIGHLQQLAASELKDLYEEMIFIRSRPGLKPCEAQMYDKLKYTEMLPRV